ncbi:imidazole glycerol phosphate synthase cyclase subunit [Chitinispirillales bacterium ANBcel5]|uniref:imidazole glycerol phosphate synthase subunit HisF n=1 Tax=Cellulosispirillum alkaliphilum TaxID=3039283 RepID=UPI002A50DBFB|nr:imidazole glycerol phosphate synthase cyclase subunit [Chitinispirillales bacterium ANBcel5]
MSSADSKTIKIMPCLDMQNGRVVKGVQFVDIRDAGDPVECCAAYCEAGADEIALLDITATVEGRATMLEVVKRVAPVATIPFSVGGGISDVSVAASVLDAGADRITVSSAAFRNPQVVKDMVQEFGSERVTVAVDAAENKALPSGYEVFIDGGRTATGKDAIEWIKTIDGFGAGTILPTSKTKDGVKSGYDLPLIQKTAAVTGAQVIASGGAGTMQHFKEAVEAGASILLAASVFHFKTIQIPELKQYLRDEGISVSM